jgi:hypothetical protein
VWRIAIYRGKARSMSNDLATSLEEEGAFAVKKGSDRLAANFACEETHAHGSG